MSELILDIQNENNKDMGWEEYKYEHKLECERHLKEMDSKIDPNDRQEDFCREESGEVLDVEHFEQWGN